MLAAYRAGLTRTRLSSSSTARSSAAQQLAGTGLHAGDAPDAGTFAVRAVRRGAEWLEQAIANAPMVRAQRARTGRRLIIGVMTAGMGIVKERPRQLTAVAFLFRRWRWSGSNAISGRMTNFGVETAEPQR